MHIQHLTRSFLFFIFFRLRRRRRCRVFAHTITFPSPHRLYSLCFALSYHLNNVNKKNIYIIFICIKIRVNFDWYKWKLVKRILCVSTMNLWDFRIVAFTNFHCVFQSTLPFFAKSSKGVLFYSLLFFTHY